jgi:O-methyltransferase involved in polyketide biosynthesis
MAGGEWVELDEPALIEHKNACLPAEKCPNPLQRFGYDFTHDLPVISTGRTLVVIEGMLEYSTGDEVTSVLRKSRRRSLTTS